MRRTHAALLILLVALALAACNMPVVPAATPPATIEPPTEEPVEIAEIETSVATEEAPSEAATSEVRDEESATVVTPQPTATVVVLTVAPTKAVPTPVSPRPADDGTIIETPPAEPVTVTVQRGDTLSEIANAYGLSSYDLAVYNDIFDTNAIEVGQVLNIPPEAVANQDSSAESPTPAPTPNPTQEPTPEATEDTLPTPEPTAVAAEQQPTPESRSYVVQRGDYLTQLAVDFDVPLADLAAANNLSVTSDLVIGQVLIIPAATGAAVSAENEPPSSSEATTYIVQRGDTLREIANEFGVSQQAILEANDLDNPNRILVGQQLIIPAAE